MSFIPVRRDWMINRIVERLLVTAEQIAEELVQQHCYAALVKIPALPVLGCVNPVPQLS
ncbi:hypothetical protein Csp1_24470 [Corynebacterium provencense]|jgi:hypothetical protein|uniref:Uncharacterized protein n=1 Tax=Corynebacterium provencense TaxID=1737425 RepID=A0A2Z3YP30_9CORY|nr:hypothetical protein Csp1_24470 [Corynebacterium provencense]MCI1255355.1 hypothetical protein [Corynebacterium provencense]